jgi:hypothetical protein
MIQSEGQWLLSFPELIKVLDRERFLEELAFKNNQIHYTENE